MKDVDVDVDVDGVVDVDVDVDVHVDVEDSFTGAREIWRSLTNMKRDMAQDPITAQRAQASCRDSLGPHFTRACKLAKGSGCLRCSNANPIRLH